MVREGFAKILHGRFLGCECSADRNRQKFLLQPRTYNDSILYINFTHTTLNNLITILLRQFLEWISVPIDPSKIKVPETTRHSIRESQVRSLLKKIEDLQTRLPTNLLSSLVDKEISRNAAEELRSDLSEHGFHLSAGIASVLNGIMEAASSIRQHADEAEAAVKRNEPGAKRIDVPEIVEKITRASKLIDEFVRPKPGRQSTLMRKGIKAGLEQLREDSPTTLFGEHFSAIGPVLDGDWFQPDEWAENHKEWPERMRAIAGDEDHPFFDGLFRARLAENEACFTVGLYLASIATTRMVYEDLIKTGVLRIFGEQYVKEEGLFESKTKFGKLTKLLKEKTSFDWYHEGGPLYMKGNIMLHSKYVDEKLKLEGISDQKLSPNAATGQRRKYREEAKTCTNLLTRLVEQMEAELHQHGRHR